MKVVANELGYVGLYIFAYGWQWQENEAVGDLKS